MPLVTQNNGGLAKNRGIHGDRDFLASIGATTAEKLKGTSSRGVDGDPVPFPPPSLPRLLLLLHPLCRSPIPLPTSDSFSPFKFS